MSRQNKYIKYILNLVKVLVIFDYLTIIGQLVTFALMLILGIRSVHNGIMTTWTQNGFQVRLTGLSTSFVALFMGIFGNLMMLLILRAIKQFLINILEDRIFVEQNVKLAQRTALYLFLSSIISSGTGVLTITHLSTKITLFNMTYILAALLVWVISVILQRAVIIAKESEFTI